MCSCIIASIVSEKFVTRNYRSYFRSILLSLKQLRILQSINLRLPLIFGSEDFTPTASSSTESSGEVVKGSSEDAVVDVV